MEMLKSRAVAKHLAFCPAEIVVVAAVTAVPASLQVDQITDAGSRLVARHPFFDAETTSTHDPIGDAGAVKTLFTARAKAALVNGFSSISSPGSRRPWCTIAFLE